MIKGSSMVLKELSSGVLRRGSKEFSFNATRRNSICGPCIGLDKPQAAFTSTSKIVSDESLGTFFENSQLIQDLQPQYQDLQNSKLNKQQQHGNGRKNSITNIINSIKNEKLKNNNNNNINSINNFNNLNGNKSRSILDRRFSIDPLSMNSIKETNIYNSFPLKPEKFKSNLNLDEKFMELEAESTFSNVWSELVKKYGIENLNFPKQVVFLAGAPGSGKGTQGDVLANALNIDQEPIVVSSLLNSPECIEIKNAGGLVNDKLVLELLLNKLSKPDYLGENNGPKQGVIIDGFPRSAKQVKFVELLYDKLCQLRTSINPNATLPRFRISVLHVSEEESVKRQLSRGQFTINENQSRKAKNLPPLEIRDTDIDPTASKKRYSLYQDQFNHLKSLESKFDFDLIDANGSKSQVENIINQTYKQPRL